MRLLEISDEQREAVGHLVRFAEEPENRYIAGKSDWVPGDRPEFCLNVNTFRTVFTITQDKKGKLYRHLSISVQGDKFPHQIAVYNIAMWFGLIGAKMRDDVATLPGKDWMIDINEEEGCVTVMQRYKNEKV